MLIIRPSALGDVCRTVPVLVSLKRAFPRAQIDWLVQDTFAPAIAAHPDLHTAVLFPRSRWSSWRRLWGRQGAGEFGGFLRRLRQSRYDLVLDCQGLARSGLFAWATGASRRIGFANAGEMGWLGLTQRVAAPRSMHTVERMLRLAEAAGAPAVRDMRLYTTAEDRAFVSGQLGLGAGAFALLAPTSRWAGKLWPNERYVTLAKYLLESEHALGRAITRVVVVGGPSAVEREQCKELSALAAREPRVVDLVGKTSVGQLMALVEASALVVGSDSAAIHMAVGFNTPMAALFGPTDVRRVGPYGREQHVVQRLLPGDVLNHKNAKAGLALMKRIRVEDVLECLAGQKKV